MANNFRKILRYAVVLLVLVAAVKGIVTCNEYRQSNTTNQPN